MWRDFVDSMMTDGTSGRAESVANVIGNDTASRRVRVPLLHGRVNRGARRLRVEVWVAFDAAGFGSEVFVPYDIAKPSRVIAAPKVMQPRRIVDAVSELEEKAEILCAQVQLFLGTPKIEAVVVRDFSLCVLAPVSAALAAGCGHLEAKGRRVFATLPRECLAGVQRRRLEAGGLKTEHLAPRVDAVFRRRPDCDHQINGRQRGNCHQFRVHRDEENAIELAR